jgi:hypothetical protein
MITIDKKTHKLPEKNFYKEIYEKTQIVIGHNNRKDTRHINGWLNRNGGNYKKTSNYTIDRDGKIFEHFSPKYYSDFIGVEQDKSNISILLVNVGWLKLNKLNNTYTDWVGHTYSKNINVLERSWRGYDYWYEYTNVQLESLKGLLVFLCDKHKIPKQCIGNNVYSEDVDIYKGITFRSNYSQDNKDISPAFNIEEIKKIKNG